jgi:predicted nucleic acid-binding protein
VIVVDANVAAKWRLTEPGTEAALDLTDGARLLFAPDLIRLEVLAAITRRVRTGEAGPDETTARCPAWLRHLQAGAGTLLPEGDLLDDAMNRTLTIRHNLQDCLRLTALLADARDLVLKLVGPGDGQFDRAVEQPARIPGVVIGPHA